MRAWAEWNPKAILVRSRIFVLVECCETCGDPLSGADLIVESKRCATCDQAA